MSHNTSNKSFVTLFVTKPKPHVFSGIFPIALSRIGRWVHEIHDLKPSISAKPINLSYVNAQSVKEQWGGHQRRHWPDPMGLGEAQLVLRAV